MDDKVINFGGKYKNKTFKQIYDNDREYCKRMMTQAGTGGNIMDFRRYVEQEK